MGAYNFRKDLLTEHISVNQCFPSFPVTFPWFRQQQKIASSQFVINRLAKRGICADTLMIKLILWVMLPIKQSERVTCTERSFTPQYPHPHPPPLHTRIHTKRSSGVIPRLKVYIDYQDLWESGSCWPIDGTESGFHTMDVNSNTQFQIGNGR